MNKTFKFFLCALAGILAVAFGVLVFFTSACVYRSRPRHRLHSAIPYQHTSPLLQDSINTGMGIRKRADIGGDAVVSHGLRYASVIDDEEKGATSAKEVPAI